MFFKSKLNSDARLKANLDKFRVKEKHEERDTSFVTGAVVFTIHASAAIATTYAVSQIFANESAITFFSICGCALFLLGCLQYALSDSMETFITHTLIVEDETKPEAIRIKADARAEKGRNWMIGLLLLDTCCSIWAWRETVHPAPIKEAVIGKTFVFAYEAAEKRYTAVVDGGYSTTRVNTIRAERDSIKSELDSETLRVASINRGLNKAGDMAKMQRMLMAVVGCIFAMWCLYQVRFKHEQTQYERTESEIEAKGGEAALSLSLAGSPIKSVSNNKSDGGVLERFARTNEQLQKQMLQQNEDHKKQMAELHKQLKEQTESGRKRDEELRKREIEASEFSHLQKQMAELQKEFSANGNGASKNGNGLGKP